MGTILASVIIAKAQIILVDAGATRWTTAELLDWLSDGQREIAGVIVEGYTKTADVTLVAGTKQSAPADCNYILRPICNASAAGARGTPLFPVPQQQLDAAQPTWHSDAAGVPEDFVYSRDMRGVFYINPQGTVGDKVSLVYVANPLAIATTDTAITVDDIYANPLLDYALYRAFLKDVEIDGMGAHALAHRAAFETTLSAMTKQGRAQPAAAA